MGGGKWDETGGDRRKVGWEEDINGPERDQRKDETNQMEGGYRIVRMEGGRKDLVVIEDERERRKTEQWEGNQQE